MPCFGFLLSRLDIRPYSNNYSTMTAGAIGGTYRECHRLLTERLAEPAPGQIQLLSGPRQVGKTTLILELAEQLGPRAIYSAADAPESALPGHWDRLFAQVESKAVADGLTVLFLDEAHLLHDWATRLKAWTDRLKRRKTPVHVVATGSSALHLAKGSRETLAGRFERLTLTHWSARSMVDGFGIPPQEAARLVVQLGSFPGAFPLRADRARWSAYVRDSILEPAIGRDLLALTQLRRPALLRQIFGIAASSPAQILSLQKLQGQLQDSGALETISSYLALLADAYLVAPLEKYAQSSIRRRSSPPKLVTLSNAFLAVIDPRGIATEEDDPARFGAWVENACLAHAWNSGQRVCYWREEPLEIDGVIEGSWGSWAIEVKTGAFQPPDLRGLVEFTRRHPAFKPLVVSGPGGQAVAERAGVAAVTWEEFLLGGPPGVV